jgi:putative transposase
MIDPEHDLPIQKQAEVLQISRSSVYYQPRPVSESDSVADAPDRRAASELSVCRQPDAARSARPSRPGGGPPPHPNADEKMGDRGHLSPAQHLQTRARTQDLPYLLRGLAITRPNQVWAMDITYIPMARGFVYLAAVVDWFSRRVLAWKLSITMETLLLHRGAGRSSFQE